LALQNEPFTREEMMVKWLEYMTLREQAGKLNDSDKIIFNNQRISLIDGNIIELKTKSSLEKEILDRFEADLLMHLRKSLKNSTVQIQLTLDETKESTKLYTSRDKLQHMIGQNQDLKLLQEALGLDYEF
jgi:predicted ribosome quality control (RQC) complex YloA/Tae2 family protein